MNLNSSRFVKYEVPPGVYEMIVINNTKNGLVNINVVTDDVTLITILDTNEFLPFNVKSFISPILGLSPL